MDFIFRAAEKFLKDHKRLMRYRKIFAVMAAVVVFATTYELILPAITIDRQRAADTPGMEVGVAAEETVEEDTSEESEDAEAEAQAEAEAKAQEEAEAAAAEEEARAAEEEAQEEKQSESEEADAAVNSSDADAAESESDASQKTEETADAENGNSAQNDADADSDTAAAGEKTVAEEADDGSDNTDAADASADAATADAAAAGTTAAAEQTIEYPVTLTYEGEDYTVTATFDETAELPVGVTLDALEILPDMIYKDADGNVLYDDYEVYLEKTVETLEKDNRLEDTYVASARFFDITFIDQEGYYVEPAAPVTVAVKYKEALSAEDTVSTAAVLFDNKKDKTEIFDTEHEVKNGAIREIYFGTEKTAVYGIAVAEKLETKELTVSGDTYEVRVSYNQKAEIPEGAELDAYELMPGTEEYEECAAKSANTDENGETASRFFNISIMVDGAEYEPKAAVDVKITLKDTAPEKVAADKEITHFTNDGDVENIPQEVEEASDGGAEVSFQMDSFSTVEVPLLGAGNSYTVEVGSTITISGISGKKNNSWKSSDNAIATVSGSSATGTVTGVSAGTAVITHSYKNGSETFSVTVTDPYTVDQTEGNLTVTVKENGNAKRLSDYSLVVEQIESSDTYYEDYQNQVLEDTGETALSFLDMYHIYLQDSSGNEVNLENQNVNLKVTMTFAQTPDGWPSGNDVKVGHYNYKKNASEAISAKGVTNVTVKDKSLTFMIKSFSTITLSAGSTSTTGGSSSVTTQEGSILDGKTFDDANEWQIVSEPYTNNAATDKVGNGDVLVQKNVIPTETENEFLVYLSIDYGSRSVWDTFFQQADYEATTSANFHGQDGTIVSSMTGNMDVTVSTSVLSGGGYGDFNIYDIDGTYLTTQRLYWRNKQGGAPENFTIYMDLGNGKYFVVGAKLKPRDHPSNLYDLNLKSGVAEELYELFSSSITINQIVDQMGQYITYLNNATGDVDSVSYDSSTRTLTWIPKIKNNPQKDTIDTVIDGKLTRSVWFRNAAELVYRVRLNVEDSGFVSCADNMNSTENDNCSYPVNTYATVTYDGTKVESFPVPYVRGLLYDIKIKKTDESGNVLPGAVFSLTGTSNTTGVDIAQSAASALTTTQLTSDENGFVTVTGLPWGTYTLVETEAPTGYRKDNSSHVADLCYTTNKTGLSISTESVDRMMQTSWKDHLVVENKKNIITVTKTVAVTGNDIQLSDVDHTIYIALRKHGTQEYVTDDSENIRYETITITGGVPAPSSVTFEGVDTGNYDVMELQEAPTSGSETVTTLAEGYRFTTSAGKKIQLAGIAGSSSNNDENGEPVQSTGNNADLRYSNESQVAFTNTYSHQTTVSKTVIKKWMYGGSEISDPEGASVKFKLYRKVGSGAPEEVADAEISLDGTVDGTESTGGELTPWQATFVDLDVEDGQGNTYIYLAREISCPDEYEPYASSSDSAPMGETDYLDLNIANTITNKRKTTSIVIKKENSEGAFLPGAKFKLFKVETDSQGETHDNQVGEEFIFSNSDSAGITIDGLPSGLYKLTETAAPAGYIITDRDITFTVNAKGSGPVITWNGGTKPDNVKGLSLTNNTGDTITVINTPGVELPETGGTGFLSPQTLCGIMAMAFVLAAAVMYGFSMRRGERRYK